MQQITIDIKEARELYKTGSASLKKKLEKSFTKKELTETIMDRIKSFEDACADQGYDPKKALPYANPNGPQNSLERSANADMKLKIIAQALREGRKADWNNSNEAKWFAVFKWDKKNSGFGFSISDCDCGFASSRVGSRLCFHTSELAEYFGKQFIDLHNESLIDND